MKKQLDYLSHLQEKLKDPRFATEYFEAALQDGDPLVIQLALKDLSQLYDVEDFST